MKELLYQALSGQNVSVTEDQLIEAFECSFDQEPSFCCVADLQAWCNTYNLTLTISGTTTNIFTITH